MAIDSTPSGEAWIFPKSDDHEALPFSTPPHWIVQCPGASTGCFARSGNIVLTLDSNGVARLFLDPHPEGTVALFLIDFAYEIDPIIGEPLSDTWISRLSDPAAKIVAETDSFVTSERAVEGFDMALAHLKLINTSQAAFEALKEDPQQTPLDALEDSAETARAGNPRLVPDTKPQVEFAIRAQIDGPIP